jgi:hypothetical protein
MTENPMDESLKYDFKQVISEIIENPFDTVTQIGAAKERKLLGDWLEKQLKEDRTIEEWEEFLHKTIECLKRGVFPDSL